jgi:hypothetical protein
VSPPTGPAPESFPALSAVPGLAHGFTLRVPELDVKVDRAAALERLDTYHAEARQALGLGKHCFVLGEQVHGGAVVVVDRKTPTPVPGVDGLITTDPGVCLGIYVADCCAVFLVDPDRRAIGLLHSGRKGTEEHIVEKAITLMQKEFGSDPARIIVQLSPCIRPPHFEIDFAALIRSDAARAGAGTIADPQSCTASDLERYYSYRAERGKTGRMLALLGWRGE